MANLVAKRHRPAAQRLDPGSHRDVIAITRRHEITNSHLGHRQECACTLDLLVAQPLRPHILRATLLHPDQVIGMMNETHLIRFDISNRKRGFKDFFGAQSSFPQRMRSALSRVGNDLYSIDAGAGLFYSESHSSNKKGCVPENWLVIAHQCARPASRGPSARTRTESYRDVNNHQKIGS